MRNGLVREFEDWLSRVDPGHEYEGTSGSGHTRRYRLSNGEIASMSSTPSKYTALTNAKAAARRALGITSESPSAAKYRHIRSNGYDGKPTRSDGGWAIPAWVDSVKERIAEIDDRLQCSNPRRDADMIRELAGRRISLAQQLERAGIAPPPIPKIF